MEIATNIQITRKMIDSLNFDKSTKKIPKITRNKGDKPMAMFIFRLSDVDAALYHLTQSLEDPLNEGAIKCLFVQESCVERFADMLKSRLKPYPQEKLENTNLLNSLKKSSEIASKLNARIILPITTDPTPIVVYDFAQDHFTTGEPSAVVTLYSFRTVKEAVALTKKEYALKSATIWCENHAAAYEIITETAFSEYYINCCNMPWAPIEECIAKKQPFSVIENSYHYETLLSAGVLKSVVFPIRTTYSN